MARNLILVVLFLHSEVEYGIKVYDSINIIVYNSLNYYSLDHVPCTCDRMLLSGFS